eukprot:TRINITY_DN33097_c0_g1_i1.p1 TRINITY_DN33097_c0_g1~~TRINITY_DN33097_c0_g1_i1.p1  ORF type:complete len:110 (-),score=30.82 TRINITY_DN33097_c0_g1_i1:111-401(-)
MSSARLYTSSYASTIKVEQDCRRAESLLDAKKIVYEKINLAVEPNRKDEMKAMSGLATLPQVFVDNRFVGGWDKLQELEDAEELDKIFMNVPKKPQ